MTINEIVFSIDEQNEDAIIFAKKINGKFLPASEAVLIELYKVEKEVSNNIIVTKCCPGFDYFLELSLVRDLTEDFKNEKGNNSLETQVDWIIHYVEFDA